MKSVLCLLLLCLPLVHPAQAQSFPASAFGAAVAPADVLASRRAWSAYEAGRGLCRYAFDNFKIDVFIAQGAPPWDVRAFRVIRNCRDNTVPQLAAPISIPPAQATLDDAALTQLRKQAAAGDSTAQNRLGELSLTGDSVAQNYADAQHWFLQAAQQNNIQAQNSLGDLYRLGVFFNPDTNEDYQQAAAWYRKAALQGDARAQLMLGLLCLHSTQLALPDEQSGRKFLLAAAAQGNTPAMVALANNSPPSRPMDSHIFYAVPPKTPEAIHWYQQAAAQGSADAQNILGLMYVVGDAGLPEDDVQGTKWTTLAAMHGSAEAQRRIGAGLFWGSGQHDFNAAYKWLRFSVSQADSMAFPPLGLMYLQGQGTAPNFAKAYVLINTSSDNGVFIGKDKLTAAAQTAAPATLAAAQKLYAQCQDRFTDACF